MKQSISVVIATHNRQQVLEKTFEAMAKAFELYPEARCVLVDNNSNDGTRTVAERYADVLRLDYLFEKKQGKNCALNKALREADLGEIVVFTDDDITPEPDWLIRINESTQEFPDYSVFGGRIEPGWPDNREPSWAPTEVWGFCFAVHNFGSQPIQYPAGSYPFGGNFWIRKNLLLQGFSYDERVGPRPKGRIMGSETTFLQTLDRAGERMIYYPQAVVTHRIQSKECTPSSVQKRAFRYGRRDVYLNGLPRLNLKKRSLLMWYCFLCVKVLYALYIWIVGFLCMSPSRRLLKRAKGMRVMGHAVESFGYEDLEPITVRKEAFGALKRA